MVAVMALAIRWSAAQNGRGSDTNNSIQSRLDKLESLWGENALKIQSLEERVTALEASGK